MGMNTYGLSEKAAFFVDAYAAAYIALSTNRSCNEIPVQIQEIIDAGSFDAYAREGKLPCGYIDPSEAQEVLESLSIEVCHCSEFEGEVETSFPEKTDAPIDMLLNDDYLVYIPCEGSPSLFKGSYDRPEQILEEFQGVFQAAGVDFPPDFDWWAHICNVSGTYFC